MCGDWIRPIYNSAFLVEAFFVWLFLSVIPFLCLVTCPIGWAKIFCRVTKSLSNWSDRSLNKTRAVIFWEREKWDGVIIMSVMEIAKFNLWLLHACDCSLLGRCLRTGNQIYISYVSLAWLPRNWSKFESGPKKKNFVTSSARMYIYGVGCANHRMK